MITLPIRIEARKLCIAVATTILFGVAAWTFPAVVPFFMLKFLPWLAVVMIPICSIYWTATSRNAAPFRDFLKKHSADFGVAFYILVFAGVSCLFEVPVILGTIKVINGLPLDEKTAIIPITTSQIIGLNLAGLLLSYCIGRHFVARELFEREYRVLYECVSFIASFFIFSVLSGIAGVIIANCYALPHG